MKWKVIKFWLRLKLRQVSTQGGLALMVLWIVKQFGGEIPAEYLPSLDAIGMALAGMILIFLKESGETDAMHEIRSDPTPSSPPAPAPGPAEPAAELRRQPPVSPEPKRDVQRKPNGAQPHGFNG